MPPKETYRALEEDPEYAFEFFLAERLNMTVARLRGEISNDELLQWSVYYGRQAQIAELAAMRASGR